MKCTIDISMDNAAFSDDPNEELARILEDLADKLRNEIMPATDPFRHKIYDINGNAVGSLVVKRTRRTND
jgi:hypothetical protein